MNDHLLEPPSERRTEGISARLSAECMCKRPLLGLPKESANVAVVGVYSLSALRSLSGQAVQLGIAVRPLWSVQTIFSAVHSAMCNDRCAPPRSSTAIFLRREAGIQIMTAFRMKPSFTPRDWNGGFRLNQKLRFARTPSAIDRGWIDCSLAAMLISTDARSATCLPKRFFPGCTRPICAL